MTYQCNFWSPKWPKNQFFKDETLTSLKFSLLSDLVVKDEFFWPSHEIQETDKEPRSWNQSVEQTEIEPEPFDIRTTTDPFSRDPVNNTLEV